MVAIKSKDVKQNFKGICEKVFRGETLMVSRPGNENIVLISERRYEELEKAQKNTEYLAKLEESFRQAERGQIVYHDLIED